MGKNNDNNIFKWKISNFIKKKGKIETLIIEDPQLHLFTDLCMDSMIKLWA